MSTEQALSDQRVRDIMSSMRERIDEDNALCSTALVDSFSEDYPDTDPTDIRLARYWQDEWAPQAVIAAHQEIQRKAPDGLLRVWRAVTIEEIDPLSVIAERLNRGEGLGVFWSHDRDQAHPHDGSHQRGVTYLIEGVVDIDDVDHEATLRTYAHPDYVGEDEIVASPNAMIQVESLVRREGWLRRSEADPEAPIPLGPLAGKRLPAATAPLTEALSYQRSSENRWPGM